jgi:hypothetical protein
VPEDSVWIECAVNERELGFSTTHVKIGPEDALLGSLNPTSYALISTANDVDVAAVFLHGFGGHPFKTWHRFQELLLASPEWLSTDAYFVSYPSTSEELSLSASYLGHFLEQICSKDTARSLAQFGRAKISPYRDLLLIGHSAGGVVVRLAVLDAVKKAIALPDRGKICDESSFLSLICGAKLRLFAPAINGARVSGTKGRLANTLGIRAMIDIFRGGSASLQELSPDSRLLSALREDTTYFAQEYPDIAVLRARTLWAHIDSIVSAFDYRHDVSWRLLSTSHTTICKPSKTFLAPFIFARQGLADSSMGAI